MPKETKGYVMATVPHDERPGILRDLRNQPGILGAEATLGPYNTMFTVQGGDGYADRLAAELRMRGASDVAVARARET